MSDYDYDPHQHESCAAMCVRTDAELAELEERSFGGIFRESLGNFCDVSAETESERPPEKEETAMEMWKRIRCEKDAKEVKAAKATAKKLVKRKKIVKLPCLWKRLKTGARNKGNSAGDSEVSKRQKLSSP